MPESNQETVSRIRDQISIPKIRREETIDLLDAIRKFCKNYIVLVIRELIKSEKTGLNFKELREQTNLDTNTLNHTLIEMKKEGFINCSGKRYYATKYGYILYGAITNALASVMAEEKSNYHLRTGSLEDSSNGQSCKLVYE